MPFDTEEVIRRTARRIGTNDTRVREFLDTYADEYIKHARETDPSIIATPEPAAVVPTPPKRPAKKQAPAAKAPRSRPPAKKAPAKAPSPTAANPADTGEMTAKAVASLPDSADTTTPDVPDGTPPPPSEVERVTADNAPAEPAEPVATPT